VGHPALFEHGGHADCEITGPGEPGRAPIAVAAHPIRDPFLKCTIGSGADAPQRSQAGNSRHIGRVDCSDYHSRERLMHLIDCRRRCFGSGCWRAGEQKPDARSHLDDAAATTAVCHRRMMGS